MSTAGTVRHTALLFALVVGCSASHGPDDAGSGGGDASRDGGGPCGVDAPVCYGGPCCTEEVVGEVDATCTARCPEGYARAGECAPDPAARCPAPWLACDLHADCVLAANTCCGPCGTPELTDFDAINGARSSEHRDAVCPDDPAPCPGCPVAPNPNLGATCQSGLCQGFDVRTMDLSACTTDADCRLRVTQCCPCGGDTSAHALIAIREDAEGAYQALVCDHIDCPECEPVYPTDEVEAYCADTGHCAVRTIAP